MKVFHEQFGAMVTPRAYKASQRLLTEVEATASQQEVLSAWMGFVREAAEEDGAGWPADLTPEYVQASNALWHVFPNMIFLHGMIDGVVCYRLRPEGHNVDRCIFDAWSLVRYAPGDEPKLEREEYANWREANLGRFLQQDFSTWRSCTRVRSHGDLSAPPESDAGARDL